MNLDHFLSLVPPAFDEDTLYAKRREPLMNFTGQYEYLSTETLMRIEKRMRLMSDPATANWGAAQGRAENGLTLLRLQYSAGDSLDTLRAFYPAALWAWEEYRQHKEAWHNSQNFVDSMSNRVPAISFADFQYAQAALPLACFGLLLGHADLMPRLVGVWDYINEELDYYDILLERLVSPFVFGRRKNPQQYTRHLPYRKLDKVIHADPEKRPALMAKYLDEWYHASRREPYHDMDSDMLFKGYWSYEAAALTWVLGIDDRSYRDMDFYPRDLADYAKQFSAQPASRPIVPQAFPGDPCPIAGTWYAVHLGMKEVDMKLNEPMPGPANGRTGMVIWYFKG